MSHQFTANDDNLQSTSQYSVPQMADNLLLGAIEGNGGQQGVPASFQFAPYGNDHTAQTFQQPQGAPMPPFQHHQEQQSPPQHQFFHQSNGFVPPHMNGAHFQHAPPGSHPVNAQSQIMIQQQQPQQNHNVSTASIPSHLRTVSLQSAPDMPMQSPGYLQRAGSSASVNSSVSSFAAPSSSAASFSMGSMPQEMAMSKNQSNAAVMSMNNNGAMFQPSMATGRSNQKKNKSDSKPATQADIDLRLLMNNIETFSLRELASIIRQLEFEGTVIEKKAKLNDKKQNITKVAAIDPQVKLSEQDFKDKLLTLPKSKKQQLFGTAWLKKACRVSAEGHVPRNRIFAKYGVRGQSKYHYCGIHLIEDCAGTGAGAVTPGGTKPNGVAISDGYNSEVSSPLKSVFDTMDSSLTSAAQSPMYSATQLSPASTHCSSFTGPNSLMALLPSNADADVTRNNAATKGSSGMMGKNPAGDGGGAKQSSHIQTSLDLGTDQAVKFIPGLVGILEQFGNNDISYGLNAVLQLPPIDYYLPKSQPLINNDVAATLYSLYKNYCTSIFESLRYMKLKTLTKSLQSFQRSLTNPVFKLYISEAMLPWVQRSDIILYQSILKMLSKLIMQPSVPEHVLRQLKHIASSYPTLLAESFQSLPKNLCLLKLNCAKRFAKLMGKIVNVCQFSTRAGSVLANEEKVQKLYETWIGNVSAEDIVLQNLPLNGPDNKMFVWILSMEIPKLLQSIKNVEPLKAKTSTLVSENNAGNFEAVISKWLHAVSAIPLKFNVLQSQFLVLFNSLLDAAIKEIYFSESEAVFINWWVVKSWIVEWLTWYGELGGFLSIFSETSTQPFANSQSQFSQESFKSSQAELHAEISAKTLESLQSDVNTGREFDGSIHQRDFSASTSHDTLNTLVMNESDLSSLGASISEAANTSAAAPASYEGDDSIQVGNADGNKPEIGNGNDGNNTDIAGDSTVIHHPSSGNEKVHTVDLLGGYFGGIDETELMAFFS